jgi:hypothetical protein
MSNRDEVMRDWDHSETSETGQFAFDDDDDDDDNEADEESSDEHVDARATHHLKKEYLHAQNTAARSQRELQGGPVLTYRRPRRSTRPNPSGTRAARNSRDASLSYSSLEAEVCSTRHAFSVRRDAYR